MPMSSLEEKFEAAVWIVQAMPKEGPVKPTVSEMLELYSLYKQATVGSCRTTQPYFFQIEERLKWNAWKSLEEMQKDDAKAEYVSKMLKICDKAEEEHNLLDYLDDPSAGDILSKHEQIREKFAILGRTSMKGHEGETLIVDGVSVKL